MQVTRSSTTSLALRLDPLSPFERAALAEVHFARRDFEDAREAWELGIYLSEPDAGPDAEYQLAEMQWNIGICHWRSAGNLRDTGRRRSALEQARVAFAESLELIDDADARGPYHYWMGRLLFDLCQYEDAIDHFQRAAGVASRDQLQARLMLGRSKLVCMDYEGAEAAFRSVITDLRELRLESSEPIGVEFNEERPWPTLLVSSLLGLASSLAERNVGYTEAHEHIRSARDVAVGLDQGADQGACMAECEETEGWIAYLEDDLAHAADSLGRALELTPDPRAYARLAHVRARQLEMQGESADLGAIRRDGIRACELAANLDVDDRYTQTIRDARRRLADLAGSAG